MKVINNLYYILLVIIIFINLENNKVEALNTTTLNYYQIRRYEEKNCTGKIMSFFVFYEHSTYSAYLNILFQCDSSNIDEVKCAMIMGYPTGETVDYDDSIIKIEKNKCFNGYTLVYEKDFNYDEKKYCVISEYSTLSCEYRPILNYGSLKGGCFKGKNYECSTISYKESTCLIYENGTISYQSGDTDVEIPSYVCMGDQNYERSVVVHAVTIKGVYDSNIKAIYAPNLKQKNKKSGTRYSSSNSIIHNNNNTLNILKSIIIIITIQLIIINNIIN